MTDFVDVEDDEEDQDDTPDVVNNINVDVIPESDKLITIQKYTMKERQRFCKININVRKMDKNIYRTVAIKRKTAHKTRPEVNTVVVKSSKVWVRMVIDARS